VFLTKKIFYEIASKSQKILVYRTRYTIYIIALKDNTSFVYKINDGNIMGRIHSVSIERKVSNIIIRYSVYQLPGLYFATTILLLSSSLILILAGALTDNKIFETISFIVFLSAISSFVTLIVVSI